MKLYLGLTPNDAPHETRLLSEFDNQLVDLRWAYAAHLSQSRRNAADAYELAAFYFPDNIETFLRRGQDARQALDQAASFVSRCGLRDLCGPAGEKIVYAPDEIRLLPPIQHPQKSIVIGLSDRTRLEAVPHAEIPTGYYKLPQTFIATGAPIVWPAFSQEMDADACLAVVIGKAGRRIAPEQAWNHVAGVTLLIDITARDINKREGATNNNLLGKNFPSSTSVGPAVALVDSAATVESMEVELSLDGVVKQKFHLRQCIFSVEQIIARWSILGLEPGDFLAIGASMASQGERLGAPAPLKAGSALRCAAPNVGELAHRVIKPGETRP